MKVVRESIWNPLVASLRELFSGLIAPISLRQFQLILFILLQLVGCSESLTGIGPFDGIWYTTVRGSEEFGDFSVYEHLYLTVEGNSFSCEAELVVPQSCRLSERYILLSEGEFVIRWYRYEIYTLLFNGKIYPNGALEGQASWKALDIEYKDKNGHGQMKGSLNPATGIGEGTIQILGIKCKWLSHHLP